MPKAMSVSWVCFLLPLAFALAWGESPQGEEQTFRRAPPPPTREQIAAVLQATHSIWAKRRKAIEQQAVKAHEMFVEHLKKKYNSDYQKAPGEVTHIMVENTMGSIYHMNTMLVKAECNKDEAEGNTTICEIPLNAKIWECKGEVVQLHGIDTPYIHDDGCTEYLKPSNEPATPGDEEEGNPYV